MNAEHWLLWSGIWLLFAPAGYPVRQVVFFSFGVESRGLENSGSLSDTSQVEGGGFCL
jgi:hypothetical protein